MDNHWRNHLNILVIQKTASKLLAYSKITCENVYKDRLEQKN